MSCHFLISFLSFPSFLSFVCCFGCSFSHHTTTCNQTTPSRTNQIQIPPPSALIPLLCLSLISLVFFLLSLSFLLSFCSLVRDLPLYFVPVVVCVPIIRSHHHLSLPPATPQPLPHANFQPCSCYFLLFCLSSPSPSSSSSWYFVLFSSDDELLKL